MNTTLLEALAGGEIIVADGAMGTQLQARGLPPGVFPEVWNDEHPEVLLEVHRAYVDAGAQLVTTNTFGANRLRMREAGLENRAAELACRGVDLARRAVGEDAWVAGSLGPSGQLMAPYGPLSVAEAEDAYAEQVRAMVEAGADVLLIETQHDAEEACAIVRTARASANLPVLCTFAFDAKGRTMMGLRPGEAATRAEQAGADAVGANCGEGPAAILAALEAMRDATTRPLVAQANAGVPQMAEGAHTVWDVTPGQMADHARRFVELGARVVGGCCGTGPEHIRAIVRALRG